MQQLVGAEKIAFPGLEDLTDLWIQAVGLPVRGNKSAVRNVQPYNRLSGNILNKEVKLYICGNFL